MTPDGRYGIHIVRQRRAGHFALMDYGPETAMTEPVMVRLLDVDALLMISAEARELLEPKKVKPWPNS